MLSSVILLVLFPTCLCSWYDLNISVTSEVEEKMVNKDVRICGFDDYREGWLNEQPFEFFDGGFHEEGETEMTNINPEDGVFPPWN